MPLPGCHRLLLDAGRVTLDLWFGDINELTSQLDDSLNQKVDALVSGRLCASEKTRICGRKICFNAMARLARPGGTLATFTSAGFVRRGLQDAGFTMQKCKGFGRKREMLCGGDGTEHYRSPAPRRGLTARAAANGKRRLSAVVLPARCCRWRYYGAAGR